MCNQKEFTNFVRQTNKKIEIMNVITTGIEVLDMFTSKEEGQKMISLIIKDTLIDKDEFELYIKNDMEDYPDYYFLYVKIKEGMSLFSIIQLQKRIQHLKRFEM